jgi:hypothetical protein
MYFDVINRVRVLKYDPFTQEYDVRLMFEYYEHGDNAFYKEHELHLPREGGLDTPEGGWKVGDEVEIRLRKRQGIDSNGIVQNSWDLLDSERGVWISNARIAYCFINNKEKYVVEHTKWDYCNKSQERTHSIVVANDIRKKTM